MRRPPLGQHFLRDRCVIETILQAAELTPEDTALEIGPGKGVLTEPLSKRVKSLTAVELDRTLAPQLQQRFADQPHVRVLQADFLHVDLDTLFRSNPIKVMGNIPYAITAPIFEKLLAWPGWSTGVFLIQREVGERMRSAPGSRTYGVLSLAVQLFAAIEAIVQVKPGAFVPPPRVHSMVVRLRRKTSLPLSNTELNDFFDLVHAAFSHRRKMLANSLALFSGIPKPKVDAWLSVLGIDPKSRAESVALDEYVRLTRPWAIFRREKN